MAPARSASRHNQAATHSMWKSRIGRLAKVIGTLCLIAFVCYQAGIFSRQGAARFSELWAGVDWLLVALSVVIALAQNLVSVLKWRVVVVAKHLRGGIRQLLAYLYIGRLYNLILPTSMGGDIVRVYRLGRLNDNMERSAAAVFVDRFTGMLLLLILSGAAVMFSFRGSSELFVLSLLFVFGVTVVLGWGAVDPRFAGLLERVAGSIDSAPLDKVAGKFAAFQDSIRELRRNHRFLVALAVYTVVFYGLAVLNVWSSALAFHWDVALLDMVIAVPLIMLVMNLPVSIGGLGLMEASYTVGFELLGYSAELGLATALLMRGKMLLDALVGGLVELGSSIR